MKPLYPALLFGTLLSQNGILFANDATEAVALTELVVTSGFRPTAHRAPCMAAMHWPG